MYFSSSPNWDFHLHPFHKSGLLMLPSEGADCIHDPIYLPEGHTIHPLVQILKGGLHGIGVGVIAFVVIAEKHLQDGLCIAAVVGWILCHTVFQDHNILIDPRHRLSSLPASSCRPDGSCFGTADTPPQPDTP